MFNKENYGYWKAISAADLEKEYPSDSSVPISAFKTAFKNTTQFNSIQRIFNFEQLALESHHVKDVINDDAEKTLSYVKKKRYIVADDLKVIESGQKKIK